MHTIRPLSDSDSLAELTALLHRAYARLGAMGLNYTAVDQSVEVTTQRIRGGACFVAALPDGRLAGTLVAQPPIEDDDCAYCRQPHVAAAHQFAVEPALQGRGIGRALLAHAESWARAQGFRELAVDTAEQAIHLIALYTRLGYRRVDEVQRPGKVYRSVVLSRPLR